MKRGLVAWYDGIDNAGVNQHTNAPTVWKDLAGTNDLLSIGNSEIGGKIFKGEVYAVRIYGRVLTDREIALHRAIDLVRFGGRRFAAVRPAVLPKGCRLSPDGETVIWGSTGLCVLIY